MTSMKAEEWSSLCVKEGEGINERRHDEVLSSLKDGVEWFIFLIINFLNFRLVKRKILKKRNTK